MEDNKNIDEIDYLAFSQQKRSKVFSQLCSIGALAAFVQGVNDYILGFPYVGLIDLFIAIVLISGYFINRNGSNHFAKIFVFGFSNISLFLFSTVVPQGVGIYLIFFPLVIFYFVSYKYEQRFYSFGFTLLTLILNIVLLATNYQLFGSINLQPVDPSSSFAINLVLSLILISLSINFLIKMNHLGEQLLWKQKDKSENLSKEILEKNLALEKTNQELDQFVYSTSHDLKAPLASIKGLLNLANMEKQTIPDTIATYLDMIRERINTLNFFIKDILDYSRNSRLDLTKDAVNISHLIQEVFATNKYLDNTKKVSLIAEVDSYLTVTIDKSRMLRILVNLVSNAIKYSDLEKSKPTIIVTALIDSNHLTMEVKDNGIGIDDSNKEKIFNMFYRGTELADGSGLGLYIAREMIHKMNGSLDFKSDLAKGSTFSIQIPLV